MKKIILNLRDLKSAELLTRAQLKEIKGGVQNTCRVGAACSGVDPWPGTGLPYSGFCVSSAICGCRDSHNNVWVNGGCGPA